MTDRPENEYLKSQIMTASPERLQMLLYDGAIRFCEQARSAMQAHDVPVVHDRLLRAQRIILELSGGLRTEVNPELCGKLASLYNYVYRLLIDANLHKEVAKLDEALELLHYQRETWQLVLQKLREERNGSVPAGSPSPSMPSTAVASAKPAGGQVPNQLIGGRLSLEG